MRTCFAGSDDVPMPGCGITRFGRRKAPPEQIERGIAESASVYVSSRPRPEQAVAFAALGVEQVRVDRGTADIVVARLSAKLRTSCLRSWTGVAGDLSLIEVLLSRGEAVSPRSSRRDT